MKKNILLLLFMLYFLFNASPAAYADTVGIDFYKAFEKHGAVMLILDSETNEIVHVNEAAAKFYGYSVEQLESMKIEDLNISSTRKISREMQAAVDEQQNYFVLKQRLSNNDIRTVEVYSYPYTNENKTLLVSIIHDITAKTRLTNAFFILLIVAVIIMGIFSFLLFRNFRKLNVKSGEIQNFNELRETFTDADQSLIFLKDENLRYIFANKAFESFYKKTSKEFVGLDDCSIVDKKLAESFRKSDLEVLRRNSIVISEVSLGERIFQSTKFPVKLLNGHYGVGAYVRDVTEEHNNKYKLEEAYHEILTINEQLKEKQYSLEEQNSIIEELNSQLEEENIRYHKQKEILQAILDSLGAGVIMFDPSGRIAFINKAWKELFNYLDFGQDVNKYDSFYISGNTWGNTGTFIQNMLTGINNSQEISSRLLSLASDGKNSYAVDLEQASPKERFLHLYSNPCISHAGHCYGRVVVVRDVSYQKEVDRLKLELISTVSHELRTPMSSILGFSELLLTRKLTEERNREYIGIINSEARRLTKLINDFLDIQRMESGKQLFNKKDIMLDSLLQEALALFEKEDGKYQFTFCKNNGNMPPVCCDRDKILQVMSNLLSNAIKYSPNGGEISVNLTMEDQRCKVSVTDKGLGIPDDVKDKLFTKFFRVDNDDRRKIGGTGLGLAICKEIIRAHDGEIGFETVYGEGSTFYFYLPCAGMETAEKPSELSCDSTSEGYGDLLIVEDDPSTVKLIKEILKDHGLVLHDASSGEEAVKLANRNSYRLIILDIALSGHMSGWDVLKYLKSNHSTSGTPIIVSSVYENKSIAAENGVTEYLVKPFESYQLADLVQKALNGKCNSKMMVKNADGAGEKIVAMLNSENIGIRKIERSGNILIITLDGEEGLESENNK